MPSGAIFVSYACFSRPLALAFAPAHGHVFCAGWRGIDISASHGADNFEPTRLDIDPPPIEAGP